MTIEITPLSGAGERRDANGAPAPCPDTLTGAAGTAPVLPLAECARRLRQINEHAAAILRVEALYEEQVGECRVWRDAEVKQHQREIERLKATVESGIRAAMAQDPFQRKTITLPTGQAGVRAGRAKLIVEDRAAFLAWAAEQRPDWLRRSEPEPNLIAVKNATRVHHDGQVVTDGPEAGEVVVVPGLRLEQGAEQFFVRTGAGGQQ